MFKMRQKGYASVFFIFFIVAIALAIYSLYDIGQVTSERQKIQNTADAVAYSTVNVVTRDMNFIAYTNRSMATNQVAIGQLVAMSSWIHMADITADNYDKVASYIQRIPYIGTIVGGILRVFTQILKQATDIFLPIIDNFAKAMIPTQDKALNFILAKAQSVYHGIAMGKSIEVYRDVAKRNDPDIEQGLAFNGQGIVEVVKTFREEFESYEPNDTRRNRKAQKRFNEFAGVVKDSRDTFQPRRNYEYWGASLWFLRFHFDRAGGTDFYMKRDRRRAMRWQWTSMDTHSFWFGTWDFWDGWDDDEVIPLGWGAAHAKNSNLGGNRNRFDYYREQRSDGRQNQWFHDGKYNRRHQSDRAWGNAWSNRRAAWSVYRPAAFSGNNRKDVDNNLASTNGLYGFRDFKHDDKKDVGPDLVVMMTKQENKIDTWKTIDEKDNNIKRSDKFRIESEGGLPSNRIYSLAKAQSYFSRPNEDGKRSRRWSIQWGRGDGLREYGNLYNPFWQTRLIETSNTERYIAIGTLGLR